VARGVVRLRGGAEEVVGVTVVADVGVGGPCAVPRPGVDEGLAVGERCCVMYLVFSLVTSERKTERPTVRGRAAVGANLPENGRGSREGDESEHS
jgi:hypothetical protein